MKKYLLATLLGSSVMIGCTNEDIVEPSYNTGKLTAVVEGYSPESRAGFESNGDFYWTKNDKISVTTTSSLTDFTTLYLLQTSVGQPSGSFEGTISGEISDYALYPSSKYHKLNGNELTYFFPSTYSYDKVDSDFFNVTKGEGNSFNSALWGKINNGHVSFKHLGGTFAIRFDKMPVAEGKLFFTTEQKINGKFTANLIDKEPMLKAVTSTALDVDNVVSISFKGATVDQSGVFYIPAPTGTYTNIRVQIQDINGKELSDIGCGDYTLRRKKIKVLKFTKAGIDAEATQVASAKEATSALENKDNVVVNNEVTNGTSIEIPQVQAPAGTETSKMVRLDEVADNATVTIKEQAASDPQKKSVDELTVSVPQKENNLSSFVIDMPNTTVALEGNAGHASFNQVTASTADNTLVLTKGVSIQELKVNKGNVRICAGAQVLSFVKGLAERVILYVEGNGKVPASLPAGFEVVRIATVENLAALQDALAQNANVIKIAPTWNETINSKVVINHAVTIDGQGNTIKTAGTGCFDCKASVTFEDLPIEAQNQKGAPVVLINHDDVVFTMNSCMLDHLTSGTGDGSANSGLGIKVAGGNNVKVLLNSTIINLNGATGCQRAIVVPGKANTVQSGCEISLNESKIDAKTTESMPFARLSMGIGYCAMPNLKLNLTRSQIRGVYYGINAFENYAADGVVMNIDSSILEGRAALNMRGGNNMTINITDSQLYGSNYYEGTTEDFATIIFDKWVAMKNVTVNVINSTIAAESNVDAWQLAIDVRSDNNGRYAAKSGFKFNFEGDSKLVSTGTGAALDYFIRYDDAQNKPTVTGEQAVTMTGCNVLMGYFNNQK